MKFQFGLIPGIIRDEMKADFWAAAKEVSEIGYECLEGGGALLQGNLKENKKRLDDLGLRLSGIGVKRDKMTSDLDDYVEKAKLFGSEYLVLYWAPCETKEQVLENAKEFDAVGAKCKEAGLSFCYHNHEHEFKTTFDGERALDILAANAPNISLQLDVAWVTFGGASPVDYIRKYQGRVPVIHLKDLESLSERGKFTSVGTGLVDITGSVKAARECGVKFVIVEQDKPRNLTGMESVRASFLNVKEAGLLNDR